MFLVICWWSRLSVFGNICVRVVWRMLGSFIVVWLVSVLVVIMFGVNCRCCCGWYCFIYGMLR